MSAILFSVIVPTRDRNDLLSLCLERLAPFTQTLNAERYEVIVTDDSLSGAARPLLAERFPWARWIAGPRRGPASNRNNGVIDARGDLVVFIDDDCLPEVDLLAAYETALDAAIATYEGRITCREGIDSPRVTAPLNLDGGALWSCNFAMRRAAFSAVGGFDERFPLPHMEDVDMRDRILAAGHRIVFVPGASVDHPVRPLPWGWRLSRMHRATVLYMHLHPPVRTLAWFLQNQLRARVSYVLRFPKTLDSVSALASIPFELAGITWHWREWVAWARRTTGSPA